jgi:Skp family chaperone for outer membrane proteins
MTIINNKPNAKTLLAQSNSILDGFRTALTKYGKVNEQIVVAEKEAEAKLTALQAEKDLLTATKLENEKYINKINNFLN